MSATLESLEAQKAVINIEVPDADVERALERAYRKLVGRYNIPGFRKGKAPRRVFERLVGKGVLWNEALEEIVAQAYAQAIDETGIEPIDRPEIDITQVQDGQPLVFKASVTVKPEAKLPDYRAIRVPFEEKLITEEDVDQAIEEARERRGQLVPVEDGTLAEGHYALIDFAGYVDGQPIERGAAEGYQVKIGSNQLIAGFETQLVGMKPDEERDITVTFPEDYPEQSLAGKTAQFHVKLLDIKRLELPALDEAFAQEAAGVESLEELRQAFQNRLARAAAQEAQREYENRVIDALLEGTEVEVPTVLIERRLDQLVADFRRQVEGFGQTLESYLEQSDKTMTDLRNDFSQRALRDVRTELALDAVAKAEGITVSDEEVQQEIDRGAEAYGTQAEAFRRFMAMPEQFDNLRESLRTRKTLERLTRIARGQEGND